MKLNDLERAMLAGEHGAAAKIAIEHQVKVGEFFGAADFVPVTQAHIMADTESLGEAGVAWLESLGRAGGKVRRTLASYAVGMRDNLCARPFGSHTYVAIVFAPEADEAAEAFTAVVAVEATVSGTREQGRNAIWVASDLLRGEKIS